MVTSFLPSEEELELVAQVYERAGSSRPGVIDGDTAVEMFAASTHLPPIILSAVWDIADKEKAGYLTEKGVAIALRLIGWAQSGEELSAGLVNIPGPLPQIQGIPGVKFEPSSIFVRLKLPPFTERDRETFLRLFEDCSPTYGLIEGDTAREAFVKFGLASKDVWKIWDIADTRKRGAVDKHDFALAMYLIQGLLSGQLAFIPSTVTEIYEEIVSSFKARGPPPSPPLSSKPTISRKPIRKSASVLVTMAPVFPPEKPPHSPRETTRPDWAVTPVEKATADQHFDSLDPENTGFVDEDVAAQFMLGFNLPPEDLAHIWDLADLNKDNRLTRDGFAIAIHLLQQRLAGAELPRVIPSSLIPPSMRTKPSDTPLRRAVSLAGPPKKPSRPPPLPPKPDSPLMQNEYLPTTPIGRATNGATSPRQIQDKNLPTPISATNSPRQTQRSSYPPTTPISPSTSGPNSPREVHPIKPRRPTVDAEQHRVLKEENISLMSKVEELSTQLDAQRDVQAANTTLTRENQSLLSKMYEMEQITSELLQANESHPVAEALTRRNQQLMLRISDLEPVQLKLDETLKRLDGSVLENRELSARLREVREEAEAASQRSLEEVDGLKRKVEQLEQGNEDLRKRAQDMERTISQTQPSNSATNPHEMEILMADVTRENEDLKERLRQMQRSTTNLLLTTSGGHAEQDDLRRENQRLATQVEELEQLTKELQSSSEDNELQRVLRDVTHENDALKGSLRQMRQQITDLQSSDRVEPLQREISDLKDEIRRLQIEIHNPQPQSNADPFVPPPAYEPF